MQFSRSQIYGASARFDVTRSMTEDDLRRVAPSVFAESAHESRSERFRPIPTIEIIRGLANEGFHVVNAKQAVCRVENRAPWTKHLLRLRRMDNLAKYSVGDTLCEILLKNANDGTAAYELMAGLFKIRCLNSLVTQSATLDEIKVRHSGDVQHKVIEGTYTVLDAAQKTLAAPVEWSQITLNTDQRNAFAEAAHVLRFGDAADSPVAQAIMPQTLLSPRRAEDRGNDLWRTFNVVQENSVKGGLHGVRYDEQNRRRRSTTRPVNGIDQDVKLNKALWILTERMAQLASSQHVAPIQ